MQDMYISGPAFITKLSICRVNNWARVELSSTANQNFNQQRINRQATIVQVIWRSIPSTNQIDIAHSQQQQERFM
jgi:hypothetical protein